MLVEGHHSDLEGFVCGCRDDKCLEISVAATLTTHNCPNISILQINTLTEGL